MNCPGCGHSMKEQKYETEMIDVCHTCGGVWLDDGEIKNIVETVNETFNPDDKVKSVKMAGQDQKNSKHKQPRCPNCSQFTDTIQYAVDSGVFIDRCPQHHGIFLDRGELVKVQVLMEQRLVRQGKSIGAVKINSKRCCPRDGTRLQEMQYESERVDICATCGGTWCDNQELAAIVQTRELAFDKSGNPEFKVTNDQLDLTIELGCVVCSKPMQRNNYNYSSGIIIDRCVEGHGVWLDHHELERIQSFAEKWDELGVQALDKYGQVLHEAQMATAAAYDQAVKEGKAAGQELSVLGRFLKMLGM